MLTFFFSFSVLHDWHFYGLALYRWSCCVHSLGPSSTCRSGSLRVDGAEGYSAVVVLGAGWVVDTCNLK